MARARMLKPGFFTNDVLAEVQPLGRILFSGLWCLSDREGRLEDRPRKIKAELLPYDDVDVDALLNDLAARGFVIRYEHGGIRYVQVTNFGKHQTPHIKEAPSTIPAPVEHGASTVQEPLNTLTNTHNQNTDTEPRAEKGTRERAADEPPSSDAVQVIASVSEITDDKPYGMVAMLCEENGKDVRAMPPDWASRQRGIAKRLIEQGHGIEQVRAYVRYRKTAWNGHEPFDLRHVEKDIAPWELASSPPRASPNGNGAYSTPADLRLQRIKDEKEEVISTLKEMEARKHGTGDVLPRNRLDGGALAADGDERNKGRVVDIAGRHHG